MLGDRSCVTMRGVKCFPFFHTLLSVSRFTGIAASPHFDQVNCGLEQIVLQFVCVRFGVAVRGSRAADERPWKVNEV